MKRIAIVLGVGLIVSYIFSPRNFQQAVLNYRTNLGKKVQKQAEKKVQDVGKTARETAEKKSESVVLSAKNTIQNAIAETTEKLNNTLEQKTQEVLGEILQKEQEIAPTVIPFTALQDEADSPTTAVKLITKNIDFLAHKGIRLNFKKDQSYRLNLINVPEDFCLFVNSHKYDLKEADWLKVTFTTSGTYDIYFDYCQQSAKHFGEIIVE